MRVTVSADTRNAAGRLSSYYSSVRSRMQVVLGAVAQTVYQAMVQYAPKKTGNLAASIKIQRGQDEYSVVVGASYAKYLDKTGRRYASGPYRGQMINFREPALQRGRSTKSAVVRAYF